MLRYTSPLLFHGPSARETALKEVPRLGRLLRDPIGEDGLKIAEAREIAELVDFTPLGDVPGVLLIGPMCRAGRGVPDVLLKTLEEFDPSRIRPLLWAEAEADVSSTIRSRCVLRWCPGKDTIPDELFSQVRKLIQSALEGDVVGILEGVKDQDPELILRGISVALNAHTMTASEEKLWVSVREILSFRDLTMIEVLSALLPKEEV